MWNNQSYRKWTQTFGEFWTTIQRSIWSCKESIKCWSRLSMLWHIHVTHMLGANHKRWKTLWKICQVQWVWTWRWFMRYRWNADRESSPPQTSIKRIENCQQICLWQISFLEMIWSQSWVQLTQPQNLDWIMSSRGKKVFPKKLTLGDSWRQSRGQPWIRLRGRGQRGRWPQRVIREM